MSIQNFTIPFDKEELTRTHFGQYGFRDHVPLPNINREITNINLQQITDMDVIHVIQQKLDLFLSIIVHGKKIELVVLIQFFRKLLKILQNLVMFMDKVAEDSVDFAIQPSDKMKLLFANKVLAYVVSSTLCIIEDLIAEKNINSGIVNANRQRNKKNSQKSDIEQEWESDREQALEIVHRWLQLPLKKLWSPPIVEDPFVGTLSQICYKILDRTKDMNLKAIQTLIFQILGILVKRYNHAIAFVINIIQLIRFHEKLAAPIGTGLIFICTEYDCASLMKGVAREIAGDDISEVDARNFGTFWETAANTQPEIMLPIIESITDYLSNDLYTLRNCAISILGIVITNVLTGEDLPTDKRILRDDCLNYLEEYILDTNSYVRSKVLQTWQKLCCERAIPISRQNQLLQACILRLEDKATNVRKQALQLLRAILQNNPFTSKMDSKKFSQNLKQAKAELKQLQSNFYHTIGLEEEIEELWNTQLPMIDEAIDQFIEKNGTNNNNNDDGEADSNEENNIDIDIKETYKKIQDFILKNKCMKAVQFAHDIFRQFGFDKAMNNEPEEMKKEVLLLFLYKIFMNSKSNNNNNNNNDEDEVEYEPNAKETWKEKLAADREEMSQLNALKAKKALVNYLQNSYTFSLQLEESIPIIEKLLYSVNPSDAIEACSYLATAYQFKVTRASSTIGKALFQIFCKDQSVCNNIANVYKEIYLGNSDNQITDRAKSMLAVKALIELLKEMIPGQSIALSKLIVSWRNNGDLDAEALKIMWEMFTFKLPNTTMEESRSALMLLKMAAESEMSIMCENLNVLVKFGLGPRAKTDLLLARDTCRAILIIKHDCSDDFNKSPIRYDNNHEMFKEIVSLLVHNFLEEKENGYTSFATDAINVIYQMADQPEKLVKEVLAQVAKLGNFIQSPDSNNENAEYSCYSLSRFLYLIGHIGVREMVHLDQSIFKELKRRNAVKELRSQIKARVANMRNRRVTVNATPPFIASNTPVFGSAQRSLRKKKSIEEEEVDLDEGAAADDVEAEHINMVLEQELMAESGYLRSFVPLILEVCRQPDKYPWEIVQANAVLALGKLMTLSSEFCEENLQLLVTILERSFYSQIRANILVGLADLMTRFPNEIEPWTSHIYGRLKDPNVMVRRTCVRMLSNLIMGEMIRVKGQVAHLALCIVDEDEEIRINAMQLFKDLSQKGNALYNILPDILSCLSDLKVNLVRADFQTIMSHVLGLVQKDRQVDSLIEKLCNRFKQATTERQWRDISYCLSVLKFSTNGIRILINDLPMLKEQIHNQYVQQALNVIIEGAKRRADIKAACIELEEKIKDLLESVENEENPSGELQVTIPVLDSDAMPPPKKLAKSKRTKRTEEEKDNESEEEEKENENTGNKSIGSNKSSKRRMSRARRSKTNDSATASNLEEEYAGKTPIRRSARRNPNTLIQSNINSPIQRNATTTTERRSSVRRSKINDLAASSNLEKECTGKTPIRRSTRRNSKTPSAQNNATPSVSKRTPTRRLIDETNNTSVVTPKLQTTS